MLITFRFPRAEVNKLIVHAASCQEHRSSYAFSIGENNQGKTPKGLHFVNDQGVYLMSTGLPPLLREGEEVTPLCTPNFVVYAEGWEQHGLSGDDWVEFISLNDILQVIGAQDPNYPYIEIELRDQEFVLLAIAPPDPPPTPKQPRSTKGKGGRRKTNK